MGKISFKKELYSKIALLKAAYNFTDRAYLHLDSDDDYYHVEITLKDESDDISYEEFTNEMLAQSVRHEIYNQTKTIREMMMARAMATSVLIDDQVEVSDLEDDQDENEILKDWFENND